ncbi:hypothetical protein D0867_12946 [Hortaea werneckii]|uniref:Thiamine-binding protein domain-containing protein n=1 Tax=Hortaea werneckii TaxID=91943 RepID=A0A3M6Y2I1_HORWE|nr:hypothetical protein D0867_12946 [Hortaea werneckii]
MDSSPQLRHLVQAMAEQEPTKLPTPSSCTAGIYLPSPSTWYLKPYSLTDLTNRFLSRTDRYTDSFRLTMDIEGTWEECMRVIGQCHTMLHSNGVVRIQSDIRVGSRTDKKQSFDDKVSAVNKLLAEDRKQ